MKNLIFILAGIASLLLFTSCEEEDSPLLFSEEYVSSPENVKMEYYSPDPCCVSKMYWIEANSCASELLIKCTNANSIFIENHENSISEEYSCSKGQWKAEVNNSNTITFRFEELDHDLEDTPLINVGFNVVSQTKKGLIRTSINVMRYTKNYDLSNP